MNLYRKTLEMLIEKNVGPDGEKPAWLKTMETIFHFGVKHAQAIDQIGQGQIPDIDMFVDVLQMNMMSMDEFRDIATPSIDNMLI